MLTAASAAPKISFDTVAMIFFSAVGLHRRELHDAFLSMMQSWIACEARRIAANIGKLPAL
jgi:hypothetical protein